MERTLECKQNSIQQAFTEVLLKYDDVFEWPEELPPIREIDHHIHLKEGEGPVNVRPYRYAHSQKSEMKKIVDMLTSGIIRPSASPYSNPILLQIKKDRGWKFCIDYQALNNVTTVDKFSITMVDELFD